MWRRPKRATKRCAPASMRTASGAARSGRPWRRRRAGRDLSARRGHLAGCVGRLPDAMAEQRLLAWAQCGERMRAADARAARRQRPSGRGPNEVGLGIVPDTPLGRVFRDAQAAAQSARRRCRRSCRANDGGDLHPERTEVTMNGTAEDVERHSAKMANRKSAQDAEVAKRTIEKGLLIVHTGKGKGKSTAAWAMLRALGRGMRAGVVQFGKGSGHRRADRGCTLRRPVVRPRSARASPGRRRTARATSPLPSARGDQSRELGRPLDPLADPRRTQHLAALRPSRSR